MKKIFSLLVVTALSTVILGSAASAAPKAPVVKRGTCSGHATWKLTVQMDAGKIEADNELFRAGNTQVWKSKFTDNGVVFGRSTATTTAGGETSSTRRATNQAGADHIVVRSVNQTTGQVCTAQATF